MIDVPLERLLKGDDAVELLVADLSLARAFYAGIPAARLLARTRLAIDERDVQTPPAGPGTPLLSWDALVKRLLGASLPTLDRVRRAVARQSRAASVEGPLAAPEFVVAALVNAVALSSDQDASAAEIFANPDEPQVVDADVSVACGGYDARLVDASIDPRGPVFEACVRLATIASAGPWSAERVREAARQLATCDGGIDLLRPTRASLFPVGADPELSRAWPRMANVERGELDVFVRKDPRDLAVLVARAESPFAAGAQLPSGGAPPAIATHLDKLVADLAKLLEKPGTLVLASLPPQPHEAPPSQAELNPSWLPSEWTTPEGAAAIADALERGGATLPRVRALVQRGGDPALDAIGAEMLRVKEHPFASNAFAELLARSGRPRDLMRLVTYFAVAPDLAGAARALAACVNPELPTFLRGWLESMLPGDGEEPAPFGVDPETSTSARVHAFVAALSPYPHLYGAIRPLLSRVSDRPSPLPPG